MKLTIPYYLHKAGAGFPSPATDYIEEDIDLNHAFNKKCSGHFYYQSAGQIHGGCWN